MKVPFAAMRILSETLSTEMIEHMNNPFNNLKLRDALFNAINFSHSGIVDVVTLGSGPFEEEDFDEFLKRHGLLPSIPSGGIETLIVGEANWKDKDMLEVLRLRSGSTLRVYSQEMFLAFLISGVDPLENEYEIKMEYAQNHQGLKFLTNVGFDWPTTSVVPDRLKEGGQPMDWPKLSLLGQRGYKVGAQGLPLKKRQLILLSAFHLNIPGDNLPFDYLNDCGTNGSPRRLKKIADTIASMCKQNKLKDADNFKDAIDDMESDLEWLRREAYVPSGFKFAWPE